MGLFPFTPIVASLLCLAAAQGGLPAVYSSPRNESPLTPRINVGDRFGDLFSRTIAYRISGFDDIVQRASGNADYIATAVSDSSLRFETQGRYDGAPDFKGTTEIRDGGATTCWEEKCSPTTDSSGLLYNPLLWGKPPASLKQGATWRVNISQAWELGPAGTQQVTVLAIDPPHHQITLLREGTGIGFFDGDAHQLPLKKGDQKQIADVKPGNAHWIGRTTFKAGVVISDELMVERRLTLQSKESGEVQATEREFIMLNATPQR